MLQFEQKLLKRQVLGNLRQLDLRSNLIDFASNDYLGLAKSASLADSMIEEWNKHANELNRVGSTGSRLMTGNSSYAQELENKIAQYHGYEAGLLFNCGYMANIGLLSAIADRENTILFDSGVHASTLEGIRLSSALAFPFRHNNLEHLESRLMHCTCRKEKFICIESIYSTDGSIAPLYEICRLAKKYHAHVIVDEAHAVGVRGPQGRGLVAEYNLTGQVFAHMHTFGKALGAHGAIVLGGCLLKQILVNFAKSFIYTTALPFYSLIAIHCSYDLFPYLECQRKHIRKLIQIFYNSSFSSSQTHIQTICVPGTKTIRCISNRLMQRGLDVRPLMSPTVQQGHEVLRICLHSFNTEQELKLLLEHIQEIMPCLI